MGGQEESPLPWLHCNECSRGFDHHNKVDDRPTALGARQVNVSKSDLVFALTSCGHVYCENCILQRQQQLRQQPKPRYEFTCPLCNGPAMCYKLEGALPRRIEQYLRPPTALLEEAVGVMLFQLGNASELIRGLRVKVAAQKDLLSKAKSELVQQKKSRELPQAENEALRRQLEASGARPPQSPAVSIRVPGQRLSLKSPRLPTIPDQTPLPYGQSSFLQRQPIIPFSATPAKSLCPPQYPSFCLFVLTDYQGHQG